jgi:hypothetical protein
MTIEASLDRIAIAMETLVASLTVTAEPTHTRSAKSKPAAVPDFVPTAEPDPTPSFMAPPEKPTAPFSDQAGMTAYIMSRYKTLGPAKGALIQQALVELGHTNISSLRPDQYGEFYVKVEAIA